VKEKTDPSADLVAQALCRALGRNWQKQRRASGWRGVRKTEPCRDRPVFKGWQAKDVALESEAHDIAGHKSSYYGNLWGTATPYRLMWSSHWAM
jgi:hypothetical protein